MFKPFISAIFVTALAFAAPATAASLDGAGGTAIYPVLSKWAASYAKDAGTNVNYQAIGSGGGIKQIESKTVDFANSDKPLKADELRANNLVQFPQVIIGITPVVNLPGIAAGQLVLDGPTLANIYLGKVTAWNDPAIAKLNPGLTLPAVAITTVHRSDGSGTTFNFANYLSKVSMDWSIGIGADTAINWVGGVAGKGNAGVAAYVKQLAGAIGYVEFAYAEQNKLTYVSMINRSGKRVAPSYETFEAAAASADFSKVSDFYLILTNQPGDLSWPITAATYMLLRSDYPPAKNGEVLKFLDYAMTKGTAQAKELDYVSLPPSVVQLIQTSWATTLPGATWK